MYRNAFQFSAWALWILVVLFHYGCTNTADSAAAVIDKEQKFPEGVEASEYFIRQADGAHFQGARVEPPFWWVGMPMQEFELLIYDQDIKGAAVEIVHPGVELLKIHEVENPNYLFLQLSVKPTVKAGTMDIQLTKGEDKRNYKYELKERESHHPLAFKGLETKDVIYLIMPDRFANGDETNDSIEGMQQTGIDREKMYFRHGGDLQGIIDRLDYLTELGVNAIWLNPVQENDQPYESYHGYAVTDHYRIDRRFGDNELYKAFVKTCHERGIKVIKDIIHNHVGDEHYFVKDLPDFDWIHQHESYWQTTYRDQVLMDPYATEYDKKQMTDGWFDRHMPDLNQKHPRLAQYLIQQNLWWIEYAGLNAYRIDTYAYPDQDFMAEWGRVMQYCYPSVSLFAETWVHGTPNQAWFTQNSRARGNENTFMPSVTDFQLYYAINEALEQEQSWTGGIARLYHTLTHDFMYEDPYRNVTFLDNHDLDRFFSRAGEDMRRFKTGLTWLFTLRGVPMLYYGTEILMKNFSHPDGQVREDFPGGWKDDPINKFEAAGRSQEEQEAWQYIKQLIKLRKETNALGAGSFKHFVPEKGSYVYFRFDEKDTVMVVSNAHNKTNLVSFDRMKEFLGTSKTATDVFTGEQFKISGNMELGPYESKIYRW